ncbi:unnamed protein product, partial [Prorocentrum cordatum]
MRKAEEMFFTEEGEVVKHSMATKQAALDAAYQALVQDMEQAIARSTDTQLRQPSLRGKPPTVKWVPATAFQKKHQKSWVWGSLAKPLIWLRGKAQETRAFFAGKCNEIRNRDPHHQVTPQRKCHEFRCPESVTSISRYDVNWALEEVQSPPQQLSNSGSLQQALDTFRNLLLAISLDSQAGCLNAELVDRMFVDFLDELESSISQEERQSANDSNKQWRDWAAEDLYQKALHNKFSTHILSVILNQHKSRRLVSFSSMVTDVGYTTRGIPAGDSFATYLVQMYCINELDAWQSQHSMVQLSVFIDDFLQQAESSSMLTVLTNLTDAAHDMRQVIELDLQCPVADHKSVVLASSEKLQLQIVKALGTKGGQALDSAANLGIEDSAGRSRTYKKH